MKDFIAKKWLKQLSDRTWVCIETIKALINQRRQKYNIATLDALYDFFWIHKDFFYIANMKKRYPKTPSLLWTFIRILRTNVWIDLEILSKKTLIDKRALARLEAGDSLPCFDSYTIQKIIEVLEITKEDQNLIKIYINSSKDIENRIIHNTNSYNLFKNS